MKIRIKLEKPECMPEQNGDWIDLKSAEEVQLNPMRIVNKRKRSDGTQSVSPVWKKMKISLGVAMELPKGYEAVVLPRSSAPDNYGIILRNSEGVIDNGYRGDNDIWKFNALCITRGKESVIKVGDRIAQFRIQLKQNATFWQRLKWLFSNGKIEFEVVDTLGNEDRGGFGHTGIK